MSGRGIGGRLTVEAMARLYGDPVAYEARATEHRPTDSVAQALEIHRLRKTGLTAQDIAQCMRLQPDAVVNVLATTTQIELEKLKCSSR